MSASAVDKTGLEYWAGLDPNGFGGLSLRTTLDIPVIARVNGYALGGGMEIVLGADIVIAADTARFGLTEPRVGRLALDGGIHQLVRRIPYTQAMGMLLTGRKAEAAEMQSMGLVNEVVPADELDAAVQRWLDQILACAPTSVRAVKQMVTRTAHLTAAEARGLRLPGPHGGAGQRGLRRGRPRLPGEAPAALAGTLAVPDQDSAARRTTELEGETDAGVTDTRRVGRRRHTVPGQHPGCRHGQPGRTRGATTSRSAPPASRSWACSARPRR